MLILCTSRRGQDRGRSSSSSPSAGMMPSLSCQTALVCAGEPLASQKALPDELSFRECLVSVRKEHSAMCVYTWRRPVLCPADGAFISSRNATRKIDFMFFISKSFTKQLLKFLCVARATVDFQDIGQRFFCEVPSDCPKG